MPLKAEDDFYRSISEEESLCSLVSEETLASFNHGRESCSQTCPQDNGFAKSKHIKTGGRGGV